MDKLETLSKIKDCGLVAVVRAKDENAAAECVCAIITQGIDVLRERYCAP